MWKKSVHTHTRSRSRFPTFLEVWKKSWFDMLISKRFKLRILILETQTFPNVEKVCSLTYAQGHAFRLFCEFERCHDSTYRFLRDQNREFWFYLWDMNFAKICVWITFSNSCFKCNSLVRARFVSFRARTLYLSTDSLDLSLQDSKKISCSHHFSKFFTHVC